MKPGYKQTGVGTEREWRNCDISDLCQLQRGFDITEATRKPGSIPVYSSSGLSYFHNEAKLQPPVVITGRKGMLGRVFFVEEPCWPHDTTLWVKDFKGNDPRFVYVFLSQFRLERFDAATSVPTLNRNNVVGVSIRLPPLPEQRAIAEALSDVDALLGALDRLIAKKRDLKQAAMQQLLTGQTRLPGFHGEWEVMTLGDVADVKTGPFGSTLHESDYVRDGTPIITVEHLGEFGVEHFNLPLVSDSDRQRLRAYALEIGDIVFSRVGSVDRNALIRPAEAGWLFSGRLLRVRPDKQRVFAPFLSYQFHGEIFITEVRNVAVGQTMACLNTQILRGIPVTLPRVPEQTAIAGVLGEMDAELVGLEQRREKTRALKQGMMQELLTGRTRLV